MTPGVHLMTLATPSRPRWNRQKFQPLWRIRHLPPFQTGIRQAKLEPAAAGWGHLPTIELHISASNPTEESLAVPLQVPALASKP
jgi:hypothetical protein